ncbi:copper homeostasis protein CutF [Candidatus Symbiothrix dinenymphae]|nr:copper homeostasis protein CutF [Candidatus Symbiothrix dinenymphae]
MKKVFFTAIFATVLVGFAACKQQSKSEAASESMEVIAIDAAHNSRNSVNWQGIYKGTTPCADCEGIQTTLTLHESTYVLETVYLGKSKQVYKTEGKFVWNAEGSRITLDNEKTNGFNTQIRVGENVLWLLDREGKQIEGELAEKYMLRK